MAMNVVDLQRNGMQLLKEALNLHTRNSTLSLMKSSHRLNLLRLYSKVSGALLYLQIGP